MGNVKIVKGKKFPEFVGKKSFVPSREEKLLLLPTNMAAVKSAVNQ